MTNCRRPGICIYDGGVDFRNCGGALNHTKCQFLHMLLYFNYIIYQITIYNFQLIIK